MKQPLIDSLTMLEQSTIISKQFISPEIMKPITRGKLDADMSIIAFAIYILLLSKSGFSDFRIITSVDSNKISIFNKILGAKICVQQQLYDDEIKADFSCTETSYGRGRRPGLLFSKNGKKYFCEVDTLIGPTFFNNLRDPISNNTDWVHTIGNLGLVPYGSGHEYSFGARGVKAKENDSVFYKINNNTIERTGFNSVCELCSCMYYDGLMQIKNTSNQQAAIDAIENRAKRIIMDIST